MTSLLLTVFGVVLAAMSALIAIDYGGDYFMEGYDRAQATTIATAGDNVSAAYSLYLSQFRKAPVGVSDLVTSAGGRSFLKTVPDVGPLGTVRQSWTGLDRGNGEETSFIIEGVSPTLCQYLNARLSGADVSAAPPTAPALKSGCINYAGTGVYVYYMFLPANQYAGIPSAYVPGVAPWSASAGGGVSVTPTPTPTPSPTPTALPTPTPTPDDTGWTFCANENTQCNFPGEAMVRYGVPGSYVYLNQTATVNCSIGAFSVDPASGQVKSCSYKPTPMDPWVFCANENATCSVPAGALVRYGTSGLYATKTAAGDTPCTSATFSGDPAPNRAKACYYQSGSAPTPTPTPTPTSTPLPSYSGDLSTGVADVSQGSSGRHRFWRLAIDSVTDVGRHCTNAGTIQFRQSLLGPDLTSQAGGTAIASSIYNGNYPASAAFDGNGNSLWHDACIAGGAWIGWDFGAGNAQEVNAVLMEACGEGYAVRDGPVSGGLEFSDNGTTWTRSFSLPTQPIWSDHESRLWGRPQQRADAGGHRYWRVLETAPSQDSYSGVSQVRFLRQGLLESVYGVPMGPPNVQSGSPYQVLSILNGPSDGIIQWPSSESEQWVGYDFGAGDSVAISAVVVYPDRDLAVRGWPKLKIQYSDDGANWGDASPEYQAATWQSQVAQTFATGDQTPIPADLPVWTDCAADNQFCDFGGTTSVRYGAGFNYTMMTITDGVSCSQQLFGDPYPGHAKRCQYDARYAHATPWIACASEGGSCTIPRGATARARYGFNGGFAYLQSVSGTFACTSSTFGYDPSPGYVKTCYYAGVTGGYSDPTGTPEAGAHRFWRVLAFRANGLIPLVAASEVEFHATPGGPNLVGGAGGSAIASSSYSSYSYAPSNAFDGVADNLWASAASSSVSDIEQWIGYDFGAGNAVNVQEVYWHSRTDGYLEQSIGSGAVQYSDDGTNWASSFDFVADQITAPGQVSVIQPTSSSYGNAHRYWRIMGYALNDPYMRASEIEMREAPGGPNLARYGIPFASSYYSGAHDPVYAFDGTTAGNAWADATFTPGATWIGVDLLVPRSINQFSYASAEGTKAPTDFGLEWSDDNVTWTQAWRVNYTDWGNTEFRIFDRPN